MRNGETEGGNRRLWAFVEKEKETIIISFRTLIIETLIVPKNYGNITVRKTEVDWIWPWAKRWSFR